MSSYGVSGLIAKTKDVDADLRFMALNDLVTELNKPGLHLDAQTESLLVDQVLALLSDHNSEVKNQAVKAIGALVPKVGEKKLLIILESLTKLSATPKDDQLRDIASLGLRTAIREISTGSELANAAVSKLTPALLDQLNGKGATVSQDTMLNAAELLGETFTRFEAVIRKQQDLQQASLKGLTPLLSTGKPAVKKRAVEAIAQLVAATDNDQILSNILDQIIHPSLDKKKNSVDPIIAVSLIGSIAQRAPSKIGSHLETSKNIIGKIIAVAGSPSTGEEMETDEQDEAQNAAQAEASETVLLTLERLLLKCPKEMTPFVKNTIDLATPSISWDPNFAGDDDDDEDVDMNGEDEEEAFADDFSDDDDVSWKVRRAATRLLAAVIETRPEMLTLFTKTISPLLISRFSEREESVKLDIWSTYRRFLMIVGIQTGTISPQLGSIASSSLSPATPSRTREGTPNTLKRKRGDDTGASTPVPQQGGSEETSIAILRSQAGSIAKSVLKQLNQKSVTVAQAGFSLLDALVSVLNGGLDDYIPALASKVQAALALSSTSANLDSSSGSATSLKIVVLDFLAQLCETHPLSSFEDSLQMQIVPALAKATEDKFNKIASAAFAAISALLKSVRPVSANDDAPSLLDSNSVSTILPLFKATVKLLEASGADQEVRESAVITLGDFLFYTGDALSQDRSQALTLLKDAIRKEVTRICAVKTVAYISTSPVMASAEFSDWVESILDDVAAFLRQNNRILKSDAFASLPILVKVAGQSLNQKTINKTLEAVIPFLTTEDLPLLPHALQTIDALLAIKPSETISAQVFQDSIVPAVLAIVKSSLIYPGVGLDALLAFFALMVQGGQDEMSLIDQLKKTASRVGPKCIGAIVTAKPAIVDRVADDFLKSAKNSKSSPATIAFSLFTLGEIGRIPSYSGADQAFNMASTHFTSNVDEIRAAAAFALGNVAVGSPQLVANIVQQVAASNADDKQRALTLSALKEFIIHAKPDVLSNASESLWNPLFSICAVDGPPSVEASLPASASPEEKKKRDKRVDEQWKDTESLREHWKETETSRNVAAECLGKITLIQGQRFLPQLQARVQDPQAGIRVAVISALRYTLPEESAEFDEILSPSITSFLMLMKDPDLDVRRIALTTLNSAAHHKLGLIRSQLHLLLPLVYDETIVNQDHIRIVEMGPFKHKVDDALEVRKAAYETCYTLLDACLAKLDVHQLLGAVFRGISDDHEIRAICYLMFIRLTQVAPAAVTSKLDSTADTFEKTLKEKLKDTAVKQEQEKHQQMQKSCLRAFAALSKLSSPASTPRFSLAVNNIRNDAQWSSEFKELLSDNKSGTSRAGMDLD